MLGSISQSSTNLVQTVESPGADEEDVGGVDLNGLASRLPGTVLLGHIDDSPLHHLQHALLDAFPADITELVDPGNGSDLVDLVKEDYTGLSLVDVIVGVLEEFCHNTLNVLSDVAGHGECGAVTDGERNIQASEGKPVSPTRSHPEKSKYLAMV